MNGMRMFEPKSLRMQLLFRSLIIMGCLLVLIGVFQYVFMQKFLIRDKADNIQRQMRSIPHDFWIFGGDPDDWIKNMKPSGNPKDAGVGAPNAGETKNGMGPVENPREGGNAYKPDELFDARRNASLTFLPDAGLAFMGVDGKFTTISPDSSSVKAPPQLAAEVYQEVMRSPNQLHYQIIAGDKGKVLLVVLQAVSSRGGLMGTAELVTSLAPIQEVMLRQTFTFVGLSALALVMGLLTFLPVLRRTLVPLSNMVQTVERIDSGNLSERLPVDQGQQEIDALSHSFNHMLERLGTSFEAEQEAKEQMRRFIADASHELRTPLTSIHGFLEILLRGAAQRPEQLKQALTSMHSETERMNKLVRDLLQLARLDRTMEIEGQNVQLAGLLEEMEPQLRLLAGERRVSLHLDYRGEVWLDKDKMKQVILNLFHNAVQHTSPDTGSIDFSVKQEEEEVVIAVEDNGPGIAEEHLDHLFERFYRIDTSRSRKHGGAGLGLSITKSIVDLHEGTLSVESKVGEGSRFMVRLPLRHMP